MLGQVRNILELSIRNYKSTKQNLSDLEVIKLLFYSGIFTQSSFLF